MLTKYLANIQIILITSRGYPASIFRFLKITFFSKTTSFSVRKFPSLAVTVIFCFLLFIENLGSEISDILSFKAFLFSELSVISIKLIKKIKRIKKIKTIENIKNIFLFNDNKKFNLTTHS